jgi:redox-sensitive bicupin YhaK (pirin superfamily)
MPTSLSAVMPAQVRGLGSAFSVHSIDVNKLGAKASPVVVLDHFRVRGRPFTPHPHAGFSAVTYVLEDSQSGLRSRDSLGNDLVTDPGGIVWTQAGSGVLHEELPTESDRELHGVQVFVNLSSKNKHAAPEVLRLTNRDVPQWRNATGDTVRVIVGSFQGVSSPLVPVEAFNFLDIQLQQRISLPRRDDHNALVYVLKGEVVVRADGRQQKVSNEHAITLNGSGAPVTLQATHPAHLLVLSGSEIREPVVARGSFIMNEQSEVDAAIARYHNGSMGHLNPAPAKSRAPKQGDTPHSARRGGAATVQSQRFRLITSRRRNK